MAPNAGGDCSDGSGDFKEGFAEDWRAEHPELATSHAVNHPVRLDCFSIFLVRRASATEIADELNESLRTICYHIDELHKTGVIRCVDAKHGGSRRGASEYFYEAVVCAEIEDPEWMTLPQSARREIAARAFRAVVALGSSSLRCEEMETDPLLRVVWMQVPVDEQGDQEYADFLKEVNERAAAFKERIGKRIDEGAAQTTTRVISLLSFRRGDPGERAKRKQK